MGTESEGEKRNVSRGREKLLSDCTVLQVLSFNKNETNYKKKKNIPSNCVAVQLVNMSDLVFLINSFYIA